MLNQIVTLTSKLGNTVRRLTIFKSIDCQLDSLMPWLVLSTFLVLASFLIIVYPVTPVTAVKKNPLAVFNTEAVLTALKHPNGKHVKMTFTPTSAPDKEILAHENLINTPVKKSLYEKYLIKWQNVVLASANAYVAKHGIPTGKVVVEVRVLPNGSIDSYHVVMSTNQAINPVITRILLRAAPYPKLPTLLARNLGVVIDRTWNFT